MVDVLKNALSRAQQAARTRPLKEQLAQNDAFIQRSQKRIASLERERAEEQALLDKALVREERLKQEVAAAEPVPAEVPMQESSTECFVPQGEGGPVGSGTNPSSSPRVRRRRREFAVVIDEAQNWELSRGQFAEMPSTFTIWNQSVC